MYRKKIMAMAAGLILAVGAAGCGTEKGDDTTAILQKAQDTMSKLESLSADSETKIVMKNDSETETTMIWRNQEIFMNPFKMHYKTKVMLGEGSEVVDAEEQYAEERDGMVHTYMITVGDVFADSYGAEEFIGEQALADLDLYLTKLQSAQTVGTEEINGVSATVVTGILDGKDMADSGEEWADIREGKVDVDASIKLWITEDGYILRHEIDATALMNGMRSGVDPEAEPVDDWSYGAYVEQMTYGDFNTVPDFEIPAEVLDAA